MSESFSTILKVTPEGIFACVPIHMISESLSAPKLKTTSFTHNLFILLLLLCHFPLHLRIHQGAFAEIVKWIQKFRPQRIHTNNKYPLPVVLRQWFAILHINILLARWALGTWSIVCITVFLPEVARELIRVEEHKKADVACEEAPKMTLNEMCPHLKTMWELLSALITFYLLSLACLGNRNFPGLVLVFPRLSRW